MNVSFYWFFALAAPVAFAVSFFLTKFGIPFLKKKRMGQTILEIGPEWHKKKEGTPTMGGLFFALGATVSFLLFGLLTILFHQSEELGAAACVLVFVLSNALIGFVDDYVKFIKHRNKGLTALQKLVFQFASAALFLFGLKLCGVLDTVLYLPFGWGAWDLGIFYYPFALVLIVLFVNAVNLTDGLDGLAASNVCIVLAAFVGVFLCGFVARALPALFSVAVLGAVLAFLLFNRYPAKIFMGDTGSLFLGSVIAALAVWAGMDLCLFLVGIVFFFEALSVVLQVGYFKLTHGKRLFLMAPFHHHLEKCGLSENRIVLLFSVVTALGCVLNLYAYL